MLSGESLGNLPATSNAELAQQLSELSITGLGSGQNPRETGSRSAYNPGGRDLPDLGTSLGTRHPVTIMGTFLQPKDDVLEQKFSECRPLSLKLKSIIRLGGACKCSTNALFRMQM